MKNGKIRIIIAGGRDFNNYPMLEEKVTFCIKNLDKNDIEIVSGKCSGADRMGELYAIRNRIPIKAFPAAWDRFGKAAGPIRNIQMAGYATHLIAFHDGKSRGTAGMILIAKEKGLAVRVFRYTHP